MVEDVRLREVNVNGPDGSVIICMTNNQRGKKGRIEEQRVNKITRFQFESPPSPGPNFKNQNALNPWTRY